MKGKTHTTDGLEYDISALLGRRFIFSLARGIAPT